MAYGLPVVVNDGGSLPEIVGDAGMVVPAKDVDALASALLRVSTADTLRAEMSRRSFARARRFDWGATARATLDVYWEAMRLK